MPVASEDEMDAELEAVKAVYRALKPLERDAQSWVIRTALDRLGHPAPAARPDRTARTDPDGGASAAAPIPDAAPPPIVEDSAPLTDTTTAHVDGVSPIAAKWMLRSGLTAEGLGRLFSIGHEEIDFVANKVPGNSKTKRLKNVVFVKAIAAYLSTGAARVSDKSVREACIHYDAYDADNFKRNLDSFGREISGSKEGGYTLTPSGLTAATALVVGLVNGDGVAAAPKKKR